MLQATGPLGKNGNATGRWTTRIWWMSGAAGGVVAVMSAAAGEVLGLNGGSHQVLMLRSCCNTAQISCNGGSGQPIDEAIDAGFPTGWMWLLLLLAMWMRIGRR